MAAPRRQRDRHPRVVKDRRAENEGSTGQRAATVTGRAQDARDAGVARAVRQAGGRPVRSV